MAILWANPNHFHCTKLIPGPPYSIGFIQCWTTRFKRWPSNNGKMIIIHIFSWCFCFPNFFRQAPYVRGFTVTMQYPSLFIHGFLLLHMGVGQTLLLSILMGWTSIYQLFWGSLGARVLTNSHISSNELMIPSRSITLPLCQDAASRHFEICTRILLISFAARNAGWRFNMG